MPKSGGVILEKKRYCRSTRVERLAYSFERIKVKPGAA